MKEEDEILRKCGKQNPFRVPEGYFEDFIPKMMEQLPNRKESLVPEKQVTWWDQVRPWFYMAAMFIIILLPIRYVIKLTDTEKVSAQADNEPTDEYIETLMDYSMMDDYTLYQYLTEAEPNTSSNP